MTTEAGACEVPTAKAFRLVESALWALGSPRGAFRASRLYGARWPEVHRKEITGQRVQAFGAAHIIPEHDQEVRGAYTVLRDRHVLPGSYAHG